MTEQRRPAGRPHNVQRQAALFLGEKTYTGKRCKRCGSTVRYTKGSGCVECQKTSAIEARQLLRAARKGIKPNPAADDLDFLGGSSFMAHMTHQKSYSASGHNHEYVEDRESPDLINDKVCPVRVEKHLSTCDSETKPNSDPEPLCPQCGCGVEADHEDRGGWLQRVSPWRCTICEWVQSESLDTDDWLG